VSRVLDRDRSTCRTSFQVMSDWSRTYWRALTAPVSTKTLNSSTFRQIPGRLGALAVVVQVLVRTGLVRPHRREMLTQLRLRSPHPGREGFLRRARPSDLLLFRRNPAVVDRRWSSPDKPSACTDRRWASSCVGHRLPALAPPFGSLQSAIQPSLGYIYLALQIDR
jgi:hypothetical protein